MQLCMFRVLWVVFSDLPRIFPPHFLMIYSTDFVQNTIRLNLSKVYENQLQTNQKLLFPVLIQIFVEIYPFTKFPPPSKRFFVKLRSNLHRYALKSLLFPFSGESHQNEFEVYSGKN